ncbi:MAG: class I SAM-dependent methyltransferase [Acidobacteriota bacterium]|nr:class I SAM-dependent methyltransferase [Acidobacteriota bacterium]
MRDRSSRDWETLAQQEPWFAVLTDERFLRERMSGDDLRAFFASGEADVAHIFDLIARPDFAPKSALDFGCGVGRLTPALTKRAAHVTGVDVAPSMLRIARENVPNATFSSTIPDQRFDLIVSLIVFQHIPVVRGEALLDELLDRLADDGVAALHFTFRRPGSGLRRLARTIRGRVTLVHRIAQRVRGERLMPYMQMNEYDPARIIAIMRRHGCAVPSIIPTNHGGIEGAIVIAMR